MAEMGTNKKKKTKKENIWTADANSDDSMILMKPKLSTNTFTKLKYY